MSDAQIKALQNQAAVLNTQIGAQLATGLGQMSPQSSANLAAQQRKVQADQVAMAAAAAANRQAAMDQTQKQMQAMVKDITTLLNQMRDAKAEMQATITRA